MNIRQKNWILHKVKANSIVSNDCYIWLGNKTKGGYGLVEYTDEMTKKRHCLPVHRALYMIHHNVELARNNFVCHSCDNPACVNIDHLWLGTPKDNMRDKVAKGREAKTYRYHHRRKKYSDEIINNIRESNLSITKTARLYGVSRSYCDAIMKGKQKRPID